MLAVKQNLSLTIIYVVLYKPNDTADFFLFMVFVVNNIYIIEREKKTLFKLSKSLRTRKVPKPHKFFYWLLDKPARLMSGGRRKWFRVGGGEAVERTAGEVAAGLNLPSGLRARCRS